MHAFQQIDELCTPIARDKGADPLARFPSHQLHDGLAFL
jgi:hypothetical protein